VLVRPVPIDQLGVNPKVLKAPGSVSRLSVPRLLRFNGVRWMLPSKTSNAAFKPRPPTRRRLRPSPTLA